jgi:hypothetical protein
MTCDEFQNIVVFYVELWWNMQALIIYWHVLEALHLGGK